jgi:hypothetical protein
MQQTRGLIQQQLEGLAPLQQTFQQYPHQHQLLDLDLLLTMVHLAMRESILMAP